MMLHLETSESETLVANLRVSGVWQDQVDAIFNSMCGL